MKRKSSGNIFICVFIVTVLILFTITGCILEPAVQCFATHSLEVNVEDIIIDGDGDDQIPTEEISSMSLYAFDAQGYLVEIVATGNGKNVSLETPVGEGLTVVLWADASDPNRTFPAPTPGQDRIEDCMIALTAARSTTVYESPGDLFFGTVKVSSDGASNKVSMKRMVGQMSITVKRLREFAQTTDDNFLLVVYATQSRMNFLGNLAGEFDAAYRPKGSFNAAGLYITGAFNMFPSAEKGLTIDVYHGDKLLRSVNSASGKPINVTAGKVTNVLIDLSVLLDARISVTPWGVLEGWKEF